MGDKYINKNKVILVVGHGGIKKDPGAVNQELNITEYDWNNTFIKKFLVPSLDKSNIKYEVVYRDTYSELPNKINKLTEKGDIILSFHLNAAANTATGTEMLYYDGSISGSRLASIIQSKVLQALKLKNRGIKPKRREDRGGFLLAKTDSPCIILETFFITNNSDVKIAEDNKQLLANKIVEGIEEYYL